eukprot:6203703-Pleurochrysis_carterae.AAC.4
MICQQLAMQSILQWPVRACVMRRRSWCYGVVMMFYADLASCPDICQTQKYRRLRGSQSSIFQPKSSDRLNSNGNTGALLQRHD